MFSTKNRQAFLGEPALRAETHANLGGVCKNLDSPSLIVGGVADHVHLLCRLGRSIAIADFIREINCASSKWLKAKSAGFADFYWQNGWRRV